MAHTATLRALFDHPPIDSFQARGDRGLSATSSFHPVHPPGAHQTPRHIVEDPRVGPDVLHFARNYLQNNPTAPSALLLAMLQVLAFTATAAANSTEYNVQNLSSKLFEYCQLFVQEADGLPTESVTELPCVTRHGIRPDGRYVRQNTTRVILGFKGKRALDAHSNGVTNMATADNGAGTELVRSATEIGARSIIFKIGSYMAMESCPWALLFGMDYFFIFFLNKVQDGNETYHHIHCSPRLTAFHNGQQNDPSIIQAMISILLGGPAQMLGNNFTPSTQVQIRQKYPEMKGGKSPTVSKQAPSRLTVPADYKRSSQRIKKRGHSAVASIVRNLQSITLSSPASDAPERRINLSRFTTQPATSESKRRRLSRTHSGTEHHKKDAHIFLHEEVGCGVTGSVAKAVIPWVGCEQDIVVKLVEKSISTFYAEAAAYSRLQYESICPLFYGSFVGNDAAGEQVGAIVLEELPRTFEDEHDMSQQQRIQAFECVTKLHDMKIHHGDIASPCFGCNASGQVVIYDFSHSHVFNDCDANDCEEVNAARRLLLENDEEKILLATKLRDLNARFS